MNEHVDSPGTILIVEDDREMSRLIRYQLKRAGYNSETAVTGEEGLAAGRTGRFTLIILDLMLPVLNGMEVLRSLKEAGIRTPVLILSVRMELQQRVTALQLGADDYMTKPFEQQELLARIEAILRRVNPAAPPTVLEVGDIRYDIVQRKVTRDGRTILLSTLECRLLECFMRNRGSILSRDQIMEFVWGSSLESTTNVVEVYISYLRSALNDGFEKKVIRTIRGAGYVLEE